MTPSSRPDPRQVAAERAKDASRTFVVTGGAGFVGSNLVVQLQKHDPDALIIVVDNFRSGTFVNIVHAFEREKLPPFAGAVIPVAFEELEPGPLLESLEPAAVFHLAAITDTTIMNEQEMLASNTAGFVPLMQECAQRDIPLVYASSAATYGSPKQGRDRVPFPLDAAGEPNNVYGFSKWLMECEHRRLMQAMERPPRIVGLRYFNVFGPGEGRKGKMASMAYQLATQMIAGKRPRLFTAGEQARDQIYVNDVVACTMAAAGLGERSDVLPGVYNLGSGVATTFNEVADAVRKGLGFKPTELPTEYFHMPDEIRAFYQDYTCADMSQTAVGLGFKPRHDPREATELYARLLRERITR